MWYVDGQCLDMVRQVRVDGLWSSIVVLGPAALGAAGERQDIHDRSLRCCLFDCVEFGSDRPVASLACDIGFLVSGLGSAIQAEPNA